MKKIAIAYVPVIHKGYIDFFNEIKEVDKLCLVGEEVFDLLGEDFDYVVRKDSLRALPLDLMKREIEALGYAFEVEVLTGDMVKSIAADAVQIFMPKEDIGRALKAAFFLEADVIYVNIFLRWHRDNTKEEEQKMQYERVDLDTFSKEIFRSLDEEAQKSADWWRQVAAAVVSNGKVISLERNKSKPDEFIPYVYGDPRSLSKRGVNAHVTTVLHAELAVIGEAARYGIPLDGATLYTTDFPCPFCARAVAHSGIKKVYFRRGYVSLDNTEILKSAGVEIVVVE